MKGTPAIKPQIKRLGKGKKLTTSIFSSDASDFLALDFILLVIDNTAVVT